MLEKSLGLMFFLKQPRNYEGGIMYIYFKITVDGISKDLSVKRSSLKAHPVSFTREKLTLLHVTATNDLNTLKDGDPVRVAGLVTVRQRPGTAKGVVFITIEDETGFANLVVWENLFDRYCKEIVQSRLLMVEGRLQIEGEVTHVIVKRCFNLTKLLGDLTVSGKEDIPVLTLSRGDETTSPIPDARNIFHKGRNFK